MERNFEEMGLDKDGLRKYDFHQFNIQDMYKNELNNCYKCANNLHCKVHSLMKIKGYDTENKFVTAEQQLAKKYFSNNKSLKIKQKMSTAQFRGKTR